MNESYLNQHVQNLDSLDGSVNHSFRTNFYSKGLRGYNSKTRKKTGNSNSFNLQHY